MLLLLIFLIFIVLYSYVGFTIVLWVLVQLKNLITKKEFHSFDNTSELPDVSIVIPAYNELDNIHPKMQNTLMLDYPKEKLKIIWITDGSNDGSNDFIEKNYIELIKQNHLAIYHQKERKGKSAAINRAMQFVSTEIVIFCDANTQLNTKSIQNMVRHFEQKNVGCVAGEKRVIHTNSLAGEGESFYWKYESLLKKLSSDFYTCIGAVGELIAFKKSLFEKLPEDTILDDFVISMQIADKGYITQYEPNAYAEESPSENEKEEMKRKIRIAAGAFQCTFRYLNWLNIFKHPTLSFLYFSHKITRWILVPLALPFIFVLNAYLFFIMPHHLLIQYLFFIQLLLYIMIFIQHFAHLSSKIFRIPYYVVMMNVAMYIGFIRYIKGNQSSAWEKVKRKSYH